MSKRPKHQAIWIALLIPPLADIVLRKLGVISFITSEWITSIWLLVAIVVMGLYPLQPPKADSN